MQAEDRPIPCITTPNGRTYVARRARRSLQRVPRESSIRRTHTHTLEIGSTPRHPIFRFAPRSTNIPLPRAFSRNV